jgi:hypothetical protein
MQFPSDIIVVLVALAPPVLFLFVPMLFPPSRKPQIAWAAIAVGLALGITVVLLQYRESLRVCNAGLAFVSDCLGTTGGLYLYGLYFGLFALIGFLRLAFDLWKARTVTYKGLS